MLDMRRPYRRLQVSSRLCPCANHRSYSTPCRQKPLEYALCPSSDCVSVSHLHCLAREFLKENPPQSELIPRGGSCRSCDSYVLWGDIIRGCYRRQKGGVTLESEVDAEEDEASGSDKGEDPQPSQGRKRGRKPKNLKASAPAEDSEHECFDLDAISSCEESDMATQAPPPSKSRKRISTKGTKKKEPGPSSKKSVAGPSQPTKRGILYVYLRHIIVG